MEKFETELGNTLLILSSKEKNDLYDALDLITKAYDNEEQKIDITEEMYWNLRFIKNNL